MKLLAVGAISKFLAKRKRLAIIVAVPLIAILVVWRISAGKTQKQTVQTANVEKGTVVSSISTSGQILLSNIMDVNTGVTGLVKSVFVEDGDKVYAGQKILEITPDADAKQKAASAYASYVSAKNSLESARTTTYTLDSSMWAANVKFINDAVARNLSVTDPTHIQQHDDWLAAEAKYKSQQNVIYQAQLGVNNSWLSYSLVSPVITAPISGTVTNITLYPGMTISFSATSLRAAVIKSGGTPLASFNISEIDVMKVKPGQKAIVKLDSVSDKTFTGKVVRVDRIGTTTSGVTNYPVIIKLDTDAAEILPNMSATANIILETKSDVLMINSSAIQNQNGQYAVRVRKNGQIETVNVEIGLASDSQTEIVTGLSEGDEVITSIISLGTNGNNGRSVFSSFGGAGGALRMGR